MRPSPALFSVAIGQFPWLLGLRLAALQKLARATGIPSTGTRKDVAGRIGEALEIQHDRRSTNADFTKTAGPLSVLSIDMGIQNLAFTHLKLDNPFDNLERVDAGGSGFLKPEITAWRRLPLTDIASLSDSRAGAAGQEEEVLGGLSKDLTSSKLKDKGNPTLEAEIDSESDSEAATKNAKTPSSFSLPHYAETAHSLLNTLVAQYKPTHILIERQRFRSGSSSHVQEWTLRVGLFEAMLYAALEAMKKERGGNLADVGVYGIDPKRVVQFWGEKEPGFSRVEEGDKNRRPTSREVKKAKIELVAKWLEAEMSESSSDAAARRIDLSRSLPVRNLAEAYLGRLRSPAKRGLTMRGRPRGETVAKDVIKLDDLADCMLQGVTWIEWIRMRELVVRNGMAAIEGL